MFAVTAIVAAIMDIRPFSDVHERFIRYASEAHMANLARNIAEGKGAVVDNVWLLRDGGLPGDDVTHPEDYWSIYVGTIIALFFKLFGSDKEILLLAACVFKTGIAAIGSWWTYRLTHHYGAALVTALFLLFHPDMTAFVGGWSDIYLTLAVLVFGTVFCFAIADRSWKLFFTSGVLIGIAIGIKPSGALLIGCVLAYWAVYPNRIANLKKSWVLPLGLIIGLTPLAAHNLASFDSLISPSVASVTKGNWEKWLTGNHERAFYDPQAPTLSEDDKKRLGLERALSQSANFVNKAARGYIVPVWFFPFMFFYSTSFGGIWKREPRYYKKSEGIFPIFVLLMAVGGLILGGMIHMTPGYWNFLVPLLAIVTFSAMAKLPRHFLFFAAIWIIGVGIVHYSQVKPEPVPGEYKLIEQLVPEDAAVLTSNPWEIAFHTRRKAVVLPYTDDVNALKTVAQRYHAEYVLIVNKDARHRFYDGIENGIFPEYIEKVYYSDTLVVGKFRWKIQ